MLAETQSPNTEAHSDEDPVDTSGDVEVEVIETDDSDVELAQFEELPILPTAGATTAAHSQTVETPATPIANLRSVLDRSLAIPHGLGTPTLARAWTALDAADSTAAVGMVSDAVSERMELLSARAASWSATVPNANDLARLRTELQAMRDLAVTAGIQAPTLGADAQRAVDSHLGAQVGQLEDRARALLAAGRNVGTPELAMLADDIARTGHVIGIASSTSLRQRLDAILPSLAPQPD